MALLRPETIAHWHKQKWRLPDYDDGSTAIWYGPDGPQGEYATTIDYDDIYQYAITEFSPDPNNNSNNIVCITVLLSKDDVDETLRVSGVLFCLPVLRRLSGAIVLLCSCLACRQDTLVAVFLLAALLFSFHGFLLPWLRILLACGA